MIRTRVVLDEYSSENLKSLQKTPERKRGKHFKHTKRVYMSPIGNQEEEMEVSKLEREKKIGNRFIKSKI